MGKGRHALVSSVVSPDRLSIADHPDLVPVGLVPKTRLVGLVIHGYEDLVRKIQNAFADVRVDVARPGAAPSGNGSLLLFPYDFRLPVRESAEWLAREVGNRLMGLPAEARWRRVIVVAHSMGGLVARYWLGPLGGAEYCRALITFGTPHSGMSWPACSMMTRSPGGSPTRPGWGAACTMRSGPRGRSWQTAEVSPRSSRCSAGGTRRRTAPLSSTGAWW